MLLEHLPRGNVGPPVHGAAGSVPGRRGLHRRLHRGVWVPRVQPLLPRPSPSGRAAQRRVRPDLRARDHARVQRGLPAEQQPHAAAGVHRGHPGLARGGGPLDEVEPPGHIGGVHRREPCGDGLRRRQEDRRGHRRPASELHAARGVLLRGRRGGGLRPGDRPRPPRGGHRREGTAGVSQAVRGEQQVASQFRGDAERRGEDHAGGCPGPCPAAVSGAKSHVGAQCCVVHGDILSFAPSVT
mmetsp:Transcript_77124/g.218571  ORF Transcript_77124/g.218571 Transcript_77124/m.218571 type:complete len:241 (+) Transcript_77124:1691-2413(+)